MPLWPRWRARYRVRELRSVTDGQACSIDVHLTRTLCSKIPVWPGPSPTRCHRAIASAWRSSPRRSMFAGDVTGDDRLRLEDRIDEDVVAHDLLVPHGVDGLGRGEGAAPCKATLIRRSLNGGPHALSNWRRPARRNRNGD